jgi:hypothetical protein
MPVLVFVVGYEKAHKRASRVTRLCWKFMRFRRDVLSFYLYVYTLYSLSFLALKTLVSLSYNIIYMCICMYVCMYVCIYIYIYIKSVDCHYQQIF